MNPFDNSFGFLFTKAAKQLKQQLQPFLKAKQLTLKQMRLLLIIHENTGITQKVAGDMQQVDRTTMTQLVDQLEHANYLIRQRAPYDRRAYCLILTPTGTQLALASYQKITAIQNHYLAELSQAEIDYLKKIMLRLTIGGNSHD